MIPLASEREEREERLRSRLAELLAAGEKTLPGTSKRHCANLRIIDVQVELMTLEKDERDDQ